MSDTLTHDVGQFLTASQNYWNDHDVDKAEEYVTRVEHLLLQHAGSFAETSSTMLSITSDYRRVVSRALAPLVSALRLGRGIGETIGRYDYLSVRASADVLPALELYLRTIERQATDTTRHWWVRNSVGQDFGTIKAYALQRDYLMRYCDYVRTRIETFINEELSDRTTI